MLDEPKSPSIIIPRKTALTLNPQLQDLTETAKPEEDQKEIIKDEKKAEFIIPEIPIRNSLDKASGNVLEPIEKAEQNITEPAKPVEVTEQSKVDEYLNEFSETAQPSAKNKGEQNETPIETTNVDLIESFNDENIDPNKPIQSQINQSEIIAINNVNDELVTDDDKDETTKKIEEPATSANIPVKQEVSPKQEIPVNICVENKPITSVLNQFEIKKYVNHSQNDESIIMNDDDDDDDAQSSQINASKATEPDQINEDLKDKPTNKHNDEEMIIESTLMDTSIDLNNSKLIQSSQNTDLNESQTVEKETESTEFVAPNALKTRQSRRSKASLSHEAEPGNQQRVTRRSTRVSMMVVQPQEIPKKQKLTAQKIDILLNQLNQLSLKTKKITSNNMKFQLKIN